MATYIIGRDNHLINIGNKSYRRRERSVRDVDRVTNYDHERTDSSKGKEKYSSSCETCVETSNVVKRDPSKYQQIRIYVIRVCILTTKYVTTQNVFIYFERNYFDNFDNV
ncbi:hypothetical protein K0M31_005106 [Melipona bicolor]|uniref:Uncharacterized protein n=1 Tax=Melipona bicolor TaxID=60889 RepID=A0AA40KN74_9HYME|nr:hypothetical protein K0M31_005106 [Melipona bicolor]